MGILLPYKKTPAAGFEPANRRAALALRASGIPSYPTPAIVKEMSRGFLKFAIA